MSHRVHGLNPSHPTVAAIPRELLSWEEDKTPENYLGETSALELQTLGEKTQFLAIDKNKRDKEHFWGMILVEDNSRFNDIPGFERIAEGESGKTLGSLAVAAQGRYLYWGFTHAPEDMTPAGRELFRHCVWHLWKNRHRLTTPYCNAPADSIDNLLNIVKSYPAYAPQALKHLQGMVKTQEKFTTIDEVATWLAKNRPYVCADGKNGAYDSYVVDEIAMAMGASIKERESLERWIDRASNIQLDSSEGKARACLERYVDPSIAPEGGASARWDEWYKRMKNRIVFVETAGFKWIEDPRVLDKEPGPHFLKISWGKESVSLQNGGPFPMALAQVCFDSFCSMRDDLIAPDSSLEIPKVGKAESVHVEWTSGGKKFITESRKPRDPGK